MATATEKVDQVVTEEAEERAARGFPARLLDRCRGKAAMRFEHETHWLIWDGA